MKKKINNDAIEQLKQNLYKAMRLHYLDILDDDYINACVTYLHVFGHTPSIYYKIKQKKDGTSPIEMDDGSIKYFDGKSVHKNSYGKMMDSGMFDDLDNEEEDGENDENGVYMSNLADGNMRYSFRDTIENIGYERVVYVGEIGAVVLDEHYMIAMQMTAYRDVNVHLVSMIKILSDTHEDAKRAFEFIKDKLVKLPNKPKDKNIEYKIAYQDVRGISTSKFTFKKMDINIKDNYNDDIPIDRMHELIEDDKRRLILMYGKPGTGKSTLIKHLMETHPSKDFIYMDSKLMTSIGDASFLTFLMNNRGSVIILEDCEDMLIQREKHNPMMGSLLNLTDGIIGDAFKIKFICTFNTALSQVDEALLRKGRLSLKYEFKELSLDKAKKHDPEATKPETLAELYNKDEENDFSKKKTVKIGF